MTHVFALFAIHADASEPFVRYIRGEWHSLARLQRDLIATDLLEQKTDAGHTLLCRSTRLFVALDFWTTHEAYLRASRSAECQALLLQRRIWANSAFEFGAFEHPRLQELYDSVAQSAISQSTTAIGSAPALPSASSRCATRNRQPSRDEGLTATTTVPSMCARNMAK